MRLKRGWLGWVIALLLPGLGCSSNGTQAPAREAVQSSAAPLVDEAMKFPQAGQIKMELVREHLMGKQFMPGGNLATYKLATYKLATYKKGSVEYQQFLGKLPDAQQAAFLLLDWQKTLRPAKYLAHMGGYYGNDGGRPVYVFAKGAWIAGIAGLPESQADGLARQFAMRF